MQNHRYNCFCPSLRLSIQIVIFISMLSGCQNRLKPADIAPKNITPVNNQPLHINMIVDITTLSPQIISKGAKLQVLLIETSEIGLIGSVVAEQVSLLNELGEYSLNLSYMISDIDLTRPHHLKLQIMEHGEIILQQAQNLTESLATNSTILASLDLTELAIVGDEGLNLDNAVWHLTKLGEKAVENQSDKEDLHIQFIAEDNSIFGFAGCNRFSGHYQLERSNISFRQLKSTRRMCLENMMLERLFLGTLNDVEVFHLTSEHLTLFDSKGNELAQFSLSDNTF